MEYTCVFIVLTYKNTRDIETYLENFNVENSKIIIVNSFYDAFTAAAIKETALRYHCDFIDVENKGYGYGNNIGIRHAIDNYSFDYLIISNPDIEIKKFNLSFLNNNVDSIFAPKIITKDGRRQNPFYYNNLFIITALEYIFVKSNADVLLLIPYAINKVYREARLMLHKIFKLSKERIYASHGSFLIIGKNALMRMFPIYNENMFLYIEEKHLAKLARSKGIVSYYVPNIEVLHKEDGSSDEISNANLRKIGNDSYREYFKYWHNL